MTLDHPTIIHSTEQRTVIRVETVPRIIHTTEQRTVVHVETVPRIIRVATPGLQGPPGPPGEPGEQGPPGPGGDGSGPSFHTHVQTTAAKVWTIVHGLGRRPGVAVEGPDGAEMDAGVYWPDTTTVIVTLGPATAGRAHLS